ncbi:MAG: M20/M25/M40 family metallo-hydrolase [archaeon]|nr:M20/M25/M40 family metallo-hydrolase [archaeon]
MSRAEIKNFVEKSFESDFIPSLMNYIRIPNTSKLLDPDWEENRLLHKAGGLICSYAKNLGLKNATIELLQDPGRTPLVFIDVAASRENDDRTILLYSHYDKQLPGEGWDEGKGPYTPVIEGNKLYGRGSADDGYASFSAITAIKCCQELNAPTPRIILIVEGAEESDSTDLDYYFAKLMPIYGNLSLFVGMDSGSDDNEHIWVTTCLRGFSESLITIKSLSRKIQSDFYAGTVPDNYMIFRTLMSKIQNEDGSIKIEEFNYPEDQIPERRVKEMKTLVEEVGDKYIPSIPLYEKTKPLSDDVYQLVLNNLWRPCVTVTACEGIKKENENDQIQDELKVCLSFRTPPHVDGEKAAEALKKVVSELKPFKCEIKCDFIAADYGFDLGSDNFSNKIENVLDNASSAFFGKKVCFTGTGGSIPFLNFFQKTYPKTDIASLGIATRESCEHGANEFLDMDCCKKFIMCLAYTLSRY